MKRSETRYKGVWSAGYTEAMRDASAVLREFVTQGGRFSADDADAFMRGSLAMRLGDWVTTADRGGEIEGMNVLLRRSNQSTSKSNAAPGGHNEPS